MLVCSVIHALRLRPRVDSFFASIQHAKFSTCRAAAELQLRIPKRGEEKKSNTKLAGQPRPAKPILSAAKPPQSKPAIDKDGRKVIKGAPACSSAMRSDARVMCENELRFSYHICLRVHL
jgi:hypothetical protein